MLVGAFVSVSTQNWWSEDRAAPKGFEPPAF